MKKLLSIVALASLASLGLVGCGTNVGVDNPDDTNGSYTQGNLVVRYASKNENYIENINNAAKKALDQLGYFRTGETPRQNGITHYARAHGDIGISVDLAKRVVESKEGEKSEWIFVTVRYGTWGNCQKSQQVVSKISANIK